MARGTRYMPCSPPSHPLGNGKTLYLSNEKFVEIFLELMHFFFYENVMNKGDEGGIHNLIPRLWVV